MSRSILALVLIAVSAFAKSAPSGPNVLLVTIDTLRADHVGSWGYRGAHTPTLDRLAKAGVMFTDATAHAALTYPSHAAILTGRYPASMGIRVNGMNPVPVSVPTLAADFKAAGYRTGAVVASVILTKSMGLSSGFDSYDDAVPVKPDDVVALADIQRPASQVTAAAEKFLQGASGAPWFLWVHYYDPHLPYNAPTKFQNLTPGHPYDAEIAYVDDELGKLLERVDAQRTVVVVTADHGESLGDHGEPDHGYFVYDATLHVPLIFAGPGIQPRVVKEQVRSIDIAPTALALASVPVPSGMQGEDLQPLLKGGHRQDVPVSLAESWYPRLHFGWAALRSARVGEWKYISAPQPELYDLRTDPGEQQNVVRRQTVVAGRLNAEIETIEKSFGPAPEGPVHQPDAETVQRLQSLGYVGTVMPLTGVSGDDPKEHLQDYVQYRERLNRALSLLNRGAAPEAIAVLQQMVKANVRAFEAHLYLGNAYAATGDARRALGEYDAASVLNPDLATPHFEAAKVLAGTGDVKAAIERCKRGLSLDPQSAYGNDVLGVTYAHAAQWQEAMDAFRRSIAANPANARAQAGVAQASLKTGDLGQAAESFKAMVALGYQVPAAQFNLGLIAARQGDKAEAARRYQLALKADPTFRPAKEALAALKQ